MRRRGHIVSFFSQPVSESLLLFTPLELSSFFASGKPLLKLFVAIFLLLLPPRLLRTSISRALREFFVLEPIEFAY